MSLNISQNWAPYQKEIILPNPSNWDIGVTRYVPHPLPKWLVPNISVDDRRLQKIDPEPDMHNMYLQFERRFYKTQLGFTVLWNYNLFDSFSTTDLQHRIIYLSVPILKGGRVLQWDENLRAFVWLNFDRQPRKVWVDSLLHEIIHCWLWREGVSAEDNFHHKIDFWFEIEKFRLLYNHDIEKGYSWANHAYYPIC